DTRRGKKQSARPKCQAARCREDSVIDVGVTRPARRGGQGGARQRGDKGVSPRPRAALLAALRARPGRPAALEWRDARLPILGRLWATAWLPSVLLAASLVALMY